MQLTVRSCALNPTGNVTIKRHLDNVYEWLVNWDLPLNMDKCQRLVEGEADSPLQKGPPGHQVAVE